MIKTLPIKFKTLSLFRNPLIDNSLYIEDSHPLIEKYYLFPCEIFVEKESYQVTTILGTCVSVCLWDKSLNYGGINHYMLPIHANDDLPSPKYGDIATRNLIHKMLILGCKKKNLRAKVFGGADTTTGLYTQHDIGRRNVAIALEILHEEKISIIGQNTGGFQGRKIIFHTHTGDVYMKYVRSSFDNETFEN